MIRPRPDGGLGPRPLGHDALVKDMCVPVRLVGDGVHEPQHGDLARQQRRLGPVEGAMGKALARSPLHSDGEVHKARNSERAPAAVVKYKAGQSIAVCFPMVRD